MCSWILEGAELHRWTQERASAAWEECVASQTHPHFGRATRTSVIQGLVQEEDSRPGVDVHRYRSLTILQRLHGGVIFVDELVPGAEVLLMRRRFRCV